MKLLYIITERRKTERLPQSEDGKPPQVLKIFLRLRRFAL